jgi:hypothetical protein
VWGLVFGVSVKRLEMLGLRVRVQVLECWVDQVLGIRTRETRGTLDSYMQREIN